MKLVADPLAPPGPAPGSARPPAPTYGEAAAAPVPDLGALGLPGLEDVVLIGRGAYSSVYRARQPALARVVAVKILDVALDDPESQRAFNDECAATGPFSEHPNIVHVHDSGVLRDRRPFIVMSHYSGGTLASRVSGPVRLPLAEVLRIGVKLCGALDAAHRAGVVHRDVKPGNILMSRYGEPVLGDFGIASLRSGADTRLAFTPNYAAPEVLRGQPATVGADLYALSSTLHALLVGRPPFVRSEGESYDAFAARIIASPWPGLANPEVDRPAATVILSALAPVVDQRPDSAMVFGQMLQSQQERLGYAATDMPGIARSIRVPPARPATIGTPPLPTGPVASASSARPATSPLAASRSGPVPAPMALRAQTAVIDVAAALAITAIVVAGARALPGMPRPTLASSIVAFVASLAVSHLLYGTLAGQSLGRRWAKVAVVADTGTRAGLLRAFGRVFIGFGSTVPLGAGYLVGLGARGRTWPDDVTATTVAFTDRPVRGGLFWVTVLLVVACSASITISTLYLLGTA